MNTLYQFQFSHYCEKARWALDHKGVPYVCRNLVPGPHKKVTRALAPRSCVPILVIDGTILQDSTAIITALDERFPDRRLTPRAAPEAQDALAWEEYLDEEVGVTLRQWFYFHTLPDRERALRFLLDGAPWYGRPLYAVIFPKVRAAMVDLMQINAASACQSEERLRAGLARLDATLRDRRFLVGNNFSRADLTACALLSPFVAPGRPEADIASAFPAPVRAMHDEMRDRRFFRWVTITYQACRRGAPATGTRVAQGGRLPPAAPRPRSTSTGA